MAIYCPIIKEKVLYTECLECEEKVCKKNTVEDDSKNIHKKDKA